jgi:hypothetical protein
LLSAFTTVSRIYSRIHAQSQDVIDEGENCFRLLLLNRFCSRTRVRSFEDYTKCPADLVADFHSLVTRMGQQPINVQSACDREVFHGFLTAHFCFQKFMERRKEILPHDARVSEYCQRSAQAIVEDSMDLKLADIPPQPRDSRQRVFVRCLALADRDDLLDKVRTAFLASSLIRKLAAYQQALIALKLFFFEGWPPNSELGAEELVPAQVAYLLLANPPNSVSNYIFIHDFCEPKHYEQVYGDATTSILPVLKFICDRILPIQIQSLCRLPE